MVSGKNQKQDFSQKNNSNKKNKTNCLEQFYADVTLFKKLDIT